MFLEKLISNSRSPKKWWTVFVLSMVAYLAPFAVASRLHSWPFWAELIVVISAAPVGFVIDCVVESQLHRVLRKRLAVIWRSITDDPQPDSKTMETAIGLYLEAMAWRLKSLTAEQRKIAMEARDFAGFCTAKQLIINELVAKALKDFWHVHWFARIFGIETKPRWRDYLPSEAA